MKTPRQFVQRCRTFFRREKLDAEMAEEMRVHLELQAERHRAAGMAPDEARFAAQRAFGGVEQIKERCRDQRGWVWLETIGQDLRHGFRQLVRTPGFTALAVLSLAVGIGVNATIFSVMDAAFLRPLPLRTPEEIVKFERPMLSFSEYEQVRAELQSLAGLVASSRSFLMLTGTEGLEPLTARGVSDNYFNVLGAGLSAGRLFSERSADRREPIVVLSHALWQRRFGGDPAIVGRTITLNGLPFTVVGVAAKGFTGEDRLPPTELWYPVTARPGSFSASRREFQLTGRLAAGFAPGQARAEATTIFARPQWQALGVNRLGERVRVVSEEESRMDHGGKLTFFMGPVVGLVLLVACANVSCLLLGRYEERRREIAVRLALGASRWRVLRYLLTEAALLALLGAALGLVFTTWGTRVLPTLLPATLASWAPDITLDQRVLGLTLGLSMVATLAFGLMPAWRASRLEITAMLKSDSGGLGRTPSRNVLVVLQVAIAMAFLTVAALFVRGFRSGMTRDLGFSERNLMLAYVAPEGRAKMEFGTMLDLVRERVAALPGVRGVTLASTLVGNGRTLPVRLVEDEATGNTAGRPIASNNVDAGFFATVGIPLQQGRDFDAHDTRGGRRVAIVSEAMARKLWPQGNAVGQTILAGRTEMLLREVVGVVRDVSDLAGNDAVAKPFLYLPMRQEQSGDLMLIVATRRSPAELAAPVREALRRMEMPMGSFMFDTLEGRLKMALLPQWFGAWLGGVLGVLAFVLAVSGLYGVVAYAVARRTRELGIRIALGAAPQDAVRLVVRQGLVLAAAGVVVGLPLAVAAGALLSSTLYGISPTDPLALAGSALVVITVAALASYLPARRAAQVDPMIALRVE